MKKAFTLIELLIVIAIIAILALIAIPNFLEAQTRAKVSRVKADMRSIATAIEAYFVDNNAYPVVATNVAQLTDPPGRDMFGSPLWGEADPAIMPGTDVDNRRCRALLEPIAYLSTRPPVDPFLNSSELPGYDPGGTGIYEWKDFSYMFYNFHGAFGAGWDDNYAANDHQRLLGYQVEARLNMGWSDAIPARKSKWEPNPAYNMSWMMVCPGPDGTAVFGGATNANYNSFRIFENAPLVMRFKYGAIDMYDPTNGTVSTGDIIRSNANPE